MFGVLCAWVYLPTFRLLLHTWTNDPQYSHGYLVPVFALYLLYARRERLQGVTAQSNWWGVVLLGLSGMIRIAGAYYANDWLDAFALLPTLAGLAVLLGGRAALLWAWPAIAFLVFMIPLPYRVAHLLSGPLQTLATSLSAYVMQTMGLPAFAEGNTILLQDSRIAVVEACNGLSMLLVFIALTTATAVMIRRSWFDRLLVVASSIPLAVVANVARIATTGVAQVFLGPRAAELIFHDLAGWLMMPFALGLLWVELKVVDFILVPAVAPSSEQPRQPTRPAPTVQGNQEKQKRSPARQAPIIPGLRR
jgi:exosortase